MESCTDNPDVPSRSRLPAGAPLDEPHFGRWEALDRSNTLRELTESHLLEHPHIAENDRYAELALTAFNALFELYQRLGAEAYGEEYTPPKGGPMTLEEWRSALRDEILAEQDEARESPTDAR